jgi:uncharacterized protein YjiS (DUF1127 family)
MPPHQTNITSGTEGGAARRGLDIPIALATVDGVLAAARRGAPIAPLDVASSEKDAAGPAAAPTQGILALLRQYWRAFQARRQRESLRVALADLSDRDLMDIGLTRGEIDYITPQRAIDRLRENAYLWSRGVM